MWFARRPLRRSLNRSGSEVLPGAVGRFLLADVPGPGPCHARPESPEKSAAGTAEPGVSRCEDGYHGVDGFQPRRGQAASA